MMDRYDRLIPLRYYETEIRLAIQTIVDGLYLVYKDGLYSEIFYSL